MKIRFLLFLFVNLSVVFSASANPHKFYMSICNMDFNPESKSLEIVIKFFTDDLELVIEKENENISLFIDSPKENPKTDSLISAYVLKHLKIVQNNQSKQLYVLGKEAERDYTFVYIELKDFKGDESFQLENTLFLDYFEDQVNKVNYNNKEQTRSISFHKAYTNEVF